MTSRKPYLIRALYDWIVDNGCTPYLLVDCEREDVRVPVSGVKDGKIVLNIGPNAVRALTLGNAGICFEARFAGRPQEVDIPVGAVLAVYARENGDGMMFPVDDGGDPPPDPDGAGGRPKLRVVK